MIRLLCLLVLAGSVALNVTAQKPLSQQLAATVVHIWPDSFALGEGRPARWSYDQGVILKGFEGIWKATGDAGYFNYIQKSMDFYVDNEGTVKGYKPDEYNIDHVNNARQLLLLFRVTGNIKYWKAATHMRNQLRTHPRTSEGGFWHKKIYPNQMWLDGLYMGEPFYAEYATLAHDDTAFNDIARQFTLMEKHARDAKTGLLYHGWDESRQQQWANPATGVSPNFWGRSIGWFAMALVDVLDYFPSNHPQRAELVDILNRTMEGVLKVQHPTSGLWYQVLDKPTYKGNYVESSASSMFVYAMAKGVRLGYLPAKFGAAAKKGYDGIKKEFIETGANGFTNLKGTVTVSGLGGNPYRDGSVDYYLREKVITNDPKGMGAFIQAAVEMEMVPSLSLGKGKKVMLDNYYNRETKKDHLGQPVIWHYTWDEMGNNGFSLLGDIFQQHGARLATLPTAPTAASLKGSDVYIIVDPDTERESASPNYMKAGEATVIANWVKAGGKLAMFLNDSINAEHTNFNLLAEKFGIRFNNDLKNTVQGSQFEQGAIYIPNSNPIFGGLNKVYIKELSTLAIKPPAKSNLQHNGDVIIAVAQYGKGYVFAVGDPWFYNEYIDGRKLPPAFENYGAAQKFVQSILKAKPW